MFNYFELIKFTPNSQTSLRVNQCYSEVVRIIVDYDRQTFLAFRKLPVEGKFIFYLLW